jgi:YegS/Rv2252/BmrU family lipid kinase
MARHAIKLISNPNADLGRAWRWASDLRPIADEFGGADWTGTVYPTHAGELAYQAGEDGYATVVAVGGDGTVHEVINGLMRLAPERRPRLGVVPMGSGNDFAHAVGMDPRPAFALRQVLTGEPHPLDIGMVQDNLGRTEYFDNTLGIGFDATVTIRSRSFSYLHGFLIYLLAVVQTIVLNHEAPRMQVKTDQEAWDEPMVMLVLCNGLREGGGFQISPAARTDDGRLDYTGVRKVTRLRMLRLLPEFIGGTHTRLQDVRMGKFAQMEIHADRSLVIHIDGEIFAGFGMDVHDLKITLLPGALEILRPAGSQAKDLS